MKHWLYTPLMSLLLIGSAQAGQWYAGVSAGYIEHEFSPVYGHEAGGTDSSYVNIGRGTEINVLGGYMQEIAGPLSLRFQARASANDSEWEMKLSEPARFSYKQPYTWGLSLVPVLNLTRKIAVTFEAGLLQGRAEEKKSGSPKSVYDASETLGGTALGAGLLYRLTDNMDVNLLFLHSEFDGLSYRTYTPEGTQVETVWDNPEAESWSLGVTYRF